MHLYIFHAFQYSIYYVMSCLKLLPYIYMVSLKTNSSSFMKFLKANHIIQSYLGCYTTGMLMYCMVLMLCCQICSNIVPHKQGIVQQCTWYLVGNTVQCNNVQKYTYQISIIQNAIWSLHTRWQIKASSYLYICSTCSNFMFQIPYSAQMPIYNVWNPSMCKI